MNRLERRIREAKVREKAKKRTKGWSTDKWWKGLEAGRYTDEPHKVNGKVVEGCPTCRERNRWGRHEMDERMIAEKKAMDYEKNAEGM